MIAHAVLGGTALEQPETARRQRVGAQHRHRKQPEDNRSIAAVARDTFEAEIERIAAGFVSERSIEQGPEPLQKCLSPAGGVQHIVHVVRRPHTQVPWEVMLVVHPHMEVAEEQVAKL